MEEFLANYPSLYSHKGTPVRFVVETSKGDRIVIDPLRYCAGGLVLNGSIVKTLLPEGAIKPDLLVLIDHAGQPMREVDIGEAQITSIEAFVVYPNGSTWAGRVFEDCASDLGMIVWSWELGRRMNVPNHAELFGLNLSWPHVPTTIGFLKDTTVENCGCAFIHHSCPKQCDAISKFL